MEGNSYDDASDGNEQVVHITIPWEKLPKMPIYGAVGGFTQKWQQKAVIPRVVAAYVAAGRQLTDTETEAMSYWWARAAAMQGHQVPVYLGSSLYFFGKARDTWRFPFYQPKNFNPDVFPSRNTVLLQGHRSRMLWRFVQASAYYTISRICAGVFFASWAMSATSANIARDERLKQWLHDSMENQKKKFGRSDRAEATLGERPKVHMTTGGGGVEGTMDWRTQDQAHDQDQMPPAPQQQATWPKSQPSAPRPQAQPQYQPPYQSSTAVEADPFDDDDASPVAPAARQQPPPPAPGSAWSKVRQGHVPRQEGSTQAGSWAKARQNAGQGGDQSSYSYNKGEEERAYAQEQAQKEFDEMLERERQGNAGRPNRRWK